MFASTLRIVFTLTATGAATTLSAATASALAATPASGDVTITFSQSESAAIDTMGLGAALGQLPPSFTPQAKTALGQSISRYAKQAAQDPTYQLTIVIDDPILDPNAVTVGALA
ncbi:hypothetical protein [Nocardia jejuensis]|uniref:hypothetical protein n=1 Tax=Nocardia jejuensis TaxID=328049 RepID=UPI0008346BAD|nr:hypothetical protein [Nocardia jejuensis]